MSLKVMALLLSPLPGLTQIYLGRYFRGMLFFFSFILLVDLGLVIIPCVLFAYPDNPVSRGFYMGAGMVWCYHIWDVIRILWWRERKVIQDKKNKLFHQMLICYLQDKLAEAVMVLEEILRMDRDDSNAFFYLGVIAKARGKKYRAKYLFQKALSLDPVEKWRWVIQEEV